MHLANLPPNIQLTGTRQLILELVGQNDIKYEVFKDRSVYECNMIQDDTNLSEGGLHFAEDQDLGVISEMSYLWHQEEYGSHAFRTQEYINNSVRKGIAAGIFLKWVVKGKITTIAQVMYSEDGFPIIGSFYTNEQARNKGYGTALIVCLTNMILRSGHEKCGLISDNTNIPSNIVFNKAGYKKVAVTISITTT